MQTTYQLNESQTRPWGKWQVIEITPQKIVKIIEVNVGGILSLQRHQYRDELWSIQSGSARITQDDQIFDVTAPATISIQRLQKHRIQNIGSTPLIFKETQTGDLLDENDIERFEDIYNRI